MFQTPFIYTLFDMTDKEHISRISQSPDNKLKSSISTLNMELTSQLRDKINADVRNYPADESQPMYFHHVPKFTIILFDFASFPEEFGSNLRKEMIEPMMLLDLEDSGALNWAEGLRRLYPLKTKGLQKLYLLNFEFFFFFNYLFYCSF